MRKIPFLTLTLAMLSASCAFGQESYGYGFIGGAFGGHGGLDGAFRYGIGGEGRLAPLVTAGGEIGGISQNGAGVLASGNVSVHIPARPHAIDPFVTGGFSVGHKGETGLWVNLGGGVNYWFQHRLGVRAEFRGYPGGYHLNSFAEFRFGIAFR